ncbi:uncharacterized protein [Venturia canescens]|uniref:uncharacterized protein n=1 Tax=Venturia canescens TaxID=32260 RepID=UPI001C9CB218|nr:uncharacterized protein LOC122414446 [Venturia canescens]
MDSTKDQHFYPNACHVCRAYGENVKLKRCSRCLMIAYCDRNHQKQHWQQHKKLCRILSGLLKNFGTYHGMKPFWTNNEEYWRKSTKDLALSVQILSSLEGHELLLFEVEMLFFRRSCEVCHETDPRKLQDCPNCPDSSFCVEHPKDNRHFTKCQMSKLYFEANNASPKFKNLILSKNYGESIPKNMDQLIGFFAKHCQVDKIFKSTKSWAAVLSDHLTMPYTFMYAMQQLSRPKLQKMTIHVLLRNCQDMPKPNFWHHLFHHDEVLEQLKIVFISPINLKTSTVKIQLCEECIKNKRQISVQNVGGLYTSFLAGKSYTKPDVIIGFELKIHRFDSIWDPIVTTLAKLGCPLIMTSHCIRESKADEENINSILGKKVKPHWAGKNPFPSWRPFKELEAASFQYRDEYLTVYNKLI